MAGLMNSSEGNCADDGSTSALSTATPPSPPRLVNVHKEGGGCGDGNRLTDEHRLVSTPTKGLNNQEEDEATQPSTMVASPMSSNYTISSSDGSSKDSKVDSNQSATDDDNNATAASYVGSSTNNDNDDNKTTTTTMEVTVTVLSLHGIVAKNTSKNKSSQHPHMPNAKNSKRKNRKAGSDTKQKQETVTIVASFSQNISKDRVFLTHVPSCPVQLSSSSDCTNSANNKSTTATGSNTNSSSGYDKSTGAELLLLQPIVHWPANDQTTDDPEACKALSTLQFKRQFVREDDTAGNSAASNIGNHINSSSNDDNQSKASKVSTKSNSTSRSAAAAQAQAHAQAQATNNRRFVPQTIPINLSISRNGKMALLGKVNLIINGEERGETSITVPISSSIRGSKSMNANPVKQVKKIRNIGKSKSFKERSKEEDMPMIKAKGDPFQFGLEGESAMLRVLVKVEDPNELRRAAEAASIAARDDEDEEDVTNNKQDKDDYSMEGLSIEHDANDDSSLEQDDYHHYVLQENELRILRNQLSKAGDTNKVLQMELSQAQCTAREDAQMVAALHRENARLRVELDMAAEDAAFGLQDENDGLRAELERRKAHGETLMAELEQVKLTADAERFNASNAIASGVCSSCTTTSSESSKLQSELKQAQSNSETLLHELNVSKTESEMLPFYETRVNELLDELKKRDLEVDCLKEELGDVKGYYKEQLAGALLWEEKEDDHNKKEQLADSSQVDSLLWDDGDGEASDAAVAIGDGRASRALLLGKRLAAAGLKVIEDKVATKDSDGGNDKDNDDDEPTTAPAENHEDIVPTDVSLVSADGPLAPIEEDTDAEEGEETIEPTPTEAEESNPSKKEGENSTGESPLSPDDADAKELKSLASAAEDAAQNKRGWGVRGLGTRLKGMEDKMRIRQQLFREQQQRQMEELQAKQEAERLAAGPGLGDVLISRISSKSSHGTNVATVVEESVNNKSAAVETVEEGVTESVEEKADENANGSGEEVDAQDTEKVEGGATADNIDSGEEAAASEDSSPDDAEAGVEVAEEDFALTRRESNQALLLESLASLEDDLWSSSPSHDTSINNNDEPPTAAEDTGSDEHADVEESKEKSSRVGLISRILPGRKNKSSGKESAEEEKKTEYEEPCAEEGSNDNSDATTADASKQESSLESSEKSEEIEAVTESQCGGGEDSSVNGEFNEFLRLCSSDALEESGSDAKKVEEVTSTPNEDVANDDQIPPTTPLTPGEANHIGIVVSQD